MRFSGRSGRSGLFVQGRPAQVLANPEQRVFVVGDRPGEEALGLRMKWEHIVVGKLRARRAFGI